MTIIITPVGTTTLDGKEAVFEVIQTVALTSLVLAGKAPKRLRGLQLTTFAPDIANVYTYLPSEDALALNGLVPTSYEEFLRSPAATSLTLGEGTPVRLVNYLALPAVEPLAIATEAAAVTTPDARATAPGRKRATLFTEAPLLGFGTATVLGPGKGTMRFAGFAPSAITSLDVFRAMPLGSLNLASSATTTPGSSIRGVSAGGITFTGSIPLASGSLVATPTAGTLTLALNTPQLRSNFTALVLSGKTPIAQRSISVLVEQLPITLNGQLFLTERIDERSPLEVDLTLETYAPTISFSSTLRSGVGGILSFTTERKLVVIAAPKQPLVW